MAEQPAAGDPLIGAQVGNYTVREKLGEGGMGAVYLAEHPLIGKRVALKVLHPEFSSNEDVVGRFFNEAKAVNDIQHPNIVDIIDYGAIPKPGGAKMVYFIMEFLDGLSLAEIIRGEAPLAVDRALGIAGQVADALAASHRKDIVHRDLKPDNIAIVRRRREENFVKVLDFGIAKLTGDQPGSKRTRTGIVMGTPAYMSPEQCEGRGGVDHRTDIYALGVVLFEMLTGRPPFVGEGYGEILVQHLTQPPPRPSLIAHGISTHVELVVLKALQKQAAARYQSMDDFMSAVADPVGFVEANGGVHGFLRAGLQNPAQPGGQVAHALHDGQSAPVVQPYHDAPSGPVLRPYHDAPSAPHGYVPTPPPYAGSAPAGYAPTPAPYGGPAWTTPDPGARSKKRWPLAAGAAAIAAVAVAAVLALGGGDDEARAADATEPEIRAEVTPTPAPPPEEPAVEEPAVAEEPAAEEPAAEEPARPEPRTVTIEIASEPKGATILLGGESVGVTPAELPLPAGDEPLELTLSLRGYEDEVETVVPDRDRALRFDLDRVARRPRERVRRPHHRKEPERQRHQPNRVGNDTLAPEF